MCWSANASLISFIFGWTFSIILIIRNKPYDRLWGFFFLFVTFMQFLEFLIWIDQPVKGQSCDTSPHKGNINNIASQIASIQNLMQPLVYGILAIYYIKKDLLIPIPVAIVILIVYGLCLIAWVLKNKLYDNKMCTIPKDCNHLQWPWINEKYSGNAIWIAYFTMLGIGLVISLKIRDGRILFAYLLGTMILSMKIYPFNKAAGGWWCVAAVGGPLLKIMLQ